MGYENIDNKLNSWSSKHNLLLYKKYKDEEIRSFEIIDKNGNRYQLWVDKSDNKEHINIHIWDFKNRKKTFLCKEVDIVECLDIAKLTINKWLSDK